LLAKAAEALGVAGADAATTGNVTIVAADGRSLADGEIAAAVSLHVEALPNAPLRQKSQFRTMGFNLPRLDIPAKTTGGKAFIQDMRLPGMLHARGIRGPSIGTRLELSPDTEIEAMDGVIKFVRNGDFAAVVSRREWDAVKLMRRLQASPYTAAKEPFPSGEVAETLKALPARDIVIQNTSRPTADPKHFVSQSFTRNWISHGSIAPSCALAWLKDDLLTIWTHSQGTFDVRRRSSSIAL